MRAGVAGILWSHDSFQSWVHECYGQFEAGQSVESVRLTWEFHLQEAWVLPRKSAGDTWHPSTTQRRSPACCLPVSALGSVLGGEKADLRSRF